MRTTIVAFIAAVALASAGESRAQNDWQYPDPYFGVLEIEKSLPVRAAPRSAETIRRPAEVGRQSVGRGLFRRPRTVGRGKGQSAVTDAPVK